MKKIDTVHKVKDFAGEKSVHVSETTIERTGTVTNFMSGVADFFLFTSRTVREIFSRDFEFKEFMKQCFQVGNKSLPLVSITSFIVGLVFTIQTRPTLLDFGAVSLLPGMVAV